MKSFATKEQRPVPAARKARPYVHHPMSPVQQAQQAEIHRILRSTGSQAKLTIGAPNDIYEQEADRVADQVMRTPIPQVQRQPNEAEALQMEAEPAVLQRQEVEEEEPLQGKFESVQRQRPEEDEEEKVLQGKFTTSESPAQFQSNGDEAENRTGMPDQLKTGLEQLSGMDLSGVRVHGNSSKPAQINALAYTQGQDIHLGLGQEKHLPHEGWHAVQQIQGRVRPTRQAEGVSINDDTLLEREADVMGARALQTPQRQAPAIGRARGDSVQRVCRECEDELAGTRSQRQVMGEEPRKRVLQGKSAIALRSHEQVIQRAQITVGSVTVQIDFGDVNAVAAADYVTEVESRYVAYTGAADASAIHAALAALTSGQQKWVLFAVDLLQDNTGATPAGFDRALGVQRLIAHAPSASNQPLGTLGDFENEVLRTSGWFELALSSGLTAPTGADLATIGALYNPPPGPLAPVGGALDTVRLTADLPPALTTFLTARDPASWLGTATHSIADIQSVGDEVMTEAKSFFSPWAETARESAYHGSWVYSANITDTTTQAPTTGHRIIYLTNRANLVGWRDPGTGSIFANSNFDSSRPADRAALHSIVTVLEATPAIAAVVDRLIQHTGFHDPVTRTVGINPEFDTTRHTDCQYRWRNIDTLCHELVHVLAHHDFRAAASGVAQRQILREGFTEVLAVQLQDHLRTRAASDAGLKTRLETGIAGAPCPAPPAGTVGYGAAGTSAATIRTTVGDDHFRAAYFHGRVDLVGL